MSITTTIAIIGVLEPPLAFITKQIPKQYRILLFDKNAVELTQLYDQLIANDSFAPIEQMNCATDASWEADMLILSGSSCLDESIIEKIRQVSTGKIVIIIGNQPNSPLSSNIYLSFQHLLQHSKLIQVSSKFKPFNKDSINILTIIGKDKSALDSVNLLFTAAGFTTNNSSTQIL